MLEGLLVLLPIWLGVVCVNYWRLARSHNRASAIRKSAVAAAALAATIFVVVGVGSVNRDLLVLSAPVLEALALGAEVWVLASWPHRRRLAGQALLDLDTSPRRWHLLTAGLAALAGLLLVATGGPPQASELLLAALGILAVPIVILERRVGTRITQHGLLQFRRFEPWTNVASWQWSNEPGLIEVSLRRRRFDPLDVRPLLAMRSLWPVDQSGRSAASTLLERLAGPESVGHEAHPQVTPSL